MELQFQWWYGLGGCVLFFACYFVTKTPRLLSLEMSSGATLEAAALMLL